MEKKIKLTMGRDKNIAVSLNDEIKFVIEDAKRSVDAKTIYDLLSFSPDDTYSVEVINEQNIDVPVIDYFADLIRSIVEKINLNKLE